MQPQDLYDLSWAGDPRLSPNGRTVAYVVTSIDREQNDYRAAIWLAPVDGSAPPRKLTAGEHKDSSPRWSPDGTTIAFVSNRDADHAAQIYAISVDGGEARKLTDVKDSATELAWSPDGSSIAFSARVPDAAYDEEDEHKRAPRRFTRLQYKLDNEGWIGDRRRHVFVVAADGGSPARRLTGGDFEHHHPAWSPDGASIAFASARHPDWDVDAFVDIYVTAADGSGEPQPVTHADGVCAQPSWSPNGSSIAYVFTPGLFDDPRHAQIAVVDVATRERRVLTETLDRNCSPYPPVREPIWHGADVFFGVEDRGNTHVYRAPADGSGKPEPVVEGELVVTGFDIVGGNGVHAATTPTRPPEIFFGERQISDAGAAFRASHPPLDAERFTAISADGSEVDAWMVRPDGFDAGARYPALLCIHGGPFTQYGNRFFDEVQTYAGAGYVVLYANPRGSSGNTEDWARAIRGPGEAGPGMGTVDYEDLIGVVDTALQRFDFIDGERLGVMGGSYGGFMTSWIVSHTDRFKAAISERAVNDWHSMHGASDIGWMFKGYVGADLMSDPEAWHRMSPVTYASNITTPMLIVHSENDLRCNVEQAEQLFTILRMLRRDVEMVRFPSESHELSRSGAPVHRVMRFEIILEFLARYL